MVGPLVSARVIYLDDDASLGWVEGWSGELRFSAKKGQQAVPTPSCWPFLVAFTSYTRVNNGGLKMYIEGKHAYLSYIEKDATGLP